MKRYFGYQFKQAVEELTRKIAKQFHVDVKCVHWTSDIPTAGVNNDGEVFFADVADDAVLYDIDVQRYVGFAVHEMLHRKYTDFSVRGDTEYLDQLHNAVEDAWIEHTGIDECLTGNISGLLTALLDQIVGEANATVTNWASPSQYPFIFAVYLRRHLNTYVPVPEGLEPIIHGAAAQVADCRSSIDTLKVARWIMAQLKALPKDPKSTPGKAPNGPIETQSDDAKGDVKGEGKNRLDGNPHKSPGKASAPKESDVAVEVEPTLQVAEGKAGSGSWSEGAQLTDPKHHLRPQAWLTDQPTVPARLRYEVKRLFDNSGHEDFQRNRRAGSLNVSALHKFGVTDKLFQRRHEVEGIDSAVVICLDVSGSMFDDGAKNVKYERSNRIVQAALTTKALLETLHRSQVATCVITFGSMASVIKPFSENPIKSMQKIDALGMGGGTNDYFAVRYAHKLLLLRPEQRKIAFVITDGVGRADFVRDQCKTGERLGITTIGIGIEKKVDHIYPNAVHVNKTSELGVVSFKQIKLAK
jgi:Mg-chelatase subunit ChlD